MVGMCFFFGSFYSSWFKIERKFFLGIFEVAEHEYDIGFVPGIIGAQDGGFVNLFREFSFTFVQNRVKIIFEWFLRSPITNMTSGSVREIPGVQDGGYAHLFRPFLFILV